MTPLLILFTGSGLLLAAVSVPLVLGKIGPNPWYGFRVRKTLADPAVWYPANAYAAKRLLVSAWASASPPPCCSSCRGLTSSPTWWRAGVSGWEVCWWP